MESVSKESYRDVKSFSAFLYRRIKKILQNEKETKLLSIIESLNQMEAADEWNDFISEFVEASEKEIILMVDEVDDGTNNEVFIRFLSVLRDKYNERNAESIPTFKSVILAGIHDVKNLHLRVTGKSEFRENSPWNIAAPFEVDMNFRQDEIRSLLEDYLSEQVNVQMDIDFMTQRIHFFTGGYPFLVSYLCKLIEEDFDKLDKWSQQPSSKDSGLSSL